jgi:hypothetical protein
MDQYFEDWELIEIAQSLASHIKDIKQFYTGETAEREIKTLMRLQRKVCDYLSELQN